MERTQRTRLATAGLLGLVFVSGAVVGIAGDRWLAADGTQSQPQAEAEEADGDRDQEREREGRERRRRGRYADPSLALSTMQLEAADSIVALRRRDYREAVEEFKVHQEAFEAVRDTLVQRTRQEIRALMTQDQAIRYDSLLAESDRRRAERAREHDRSEGGRR